VVVRQLNILRTASDNIIGGNNNVVSMQQTGSDQSNLTSTLIFGNTLIVTGSNQGAGTGGSVFVGRFNAVGSNQESSADAIFVVGTGTNAGNRRNAIHVDSNNNTRITGSVQISGSIILNGVTLGDGNRNGLITTGSAGALQSITGSIILSGSNVELIGLNPNNPSDAFVIRSGSMRMGDPSGSLRIATLNNQPQVIL